MATNVIEAAIRGSVILPGTRTMFSVALEMVLSVAFRENFDPEDFR